RRDRGRQREPQLRLECCVVYLAGPIDDGLAVLVDHPRQFLERARVEPSSPAAELVIGCVRDDAIEPRAEAAPAGTLPSLPHPRPHSLFPPPFPVAMIPSDTGRQPQPPAAIRGHELLGRRRLSETERLDQPPVAIGR